MGRRKSAEKEQAVHVEEKVKEVVRGMEKSRCQQLPRTEAAVAGKSESFKERSAPAGDKVDDDIGENQIPDHGTAVVVRGVFLIVIIHAHIIFSTPAFPGECSLYIKYTLSGLFSICHRREFQNSFKKKLTSTALRNVENPFKKFFLFHRPGRAFENHTALFKQNHLVQIERG